jgi:hypothetical protein
LGFHPLLFECGDVTSNRLLDVAGRFFPRLPLADATRQAGTLYYPIAIFALIDNNLSNIITF